MAIYGEYKFKAARTVVYTRFSYVANKEWLPF